MTSMDPWFLQQIKEITDCVGELGTTTYDNISPELLRKAKRMGISDARLADVWGIEGSDAVVKVRDLRLKHKLQPVYKLVDTCAAEFESFTPYFYSCYDEEDEATPTQKKKVIILGSGPNRIGQGIEFDYCCCHAAFALARRWL